MTQDEADVVVVGLGPVGITLCNLLAAAGVRVEGIDAADDVYALPRAIGMDHEVMRIFQNIGAADAIAAATGQYRASEYRSADGVLLRRFESPAEPYPLAWPPYMTFLQPELERALRANGKKFPKLTLRTGTELINLENPERPVLTLHDRASGARTRRTPRYVVGCDGATSFIRRKLGVAMEDLDFDEPWLVVDMILEDGHVPLPETNVQFCDPARPHTYVHGPDRLRRWEFMILPGENPLEINQPERIWQLLSPWLQPDQARLWRSATYNFHALVSQQWRVGSVFLAGDACHMTPPFLAQGMVQGIKDAANLAWKLAYAIGGGSERLLGTYQAERRPFIREVIEVTKRLGKVICELDPGKARARNAEMVAEMQAGQGVLVRQNLFPPIRHGLVAGGVDGPSTAGAGEPCPQPWVVGPFGRMRLDDALPPGFQLLITGDMDPSPSLLDTSREAGVAVHRVAQERSYPSLLVEEDRVLTDWLTSKGARAVLVRPDHLVFGTAAEAGVAEQLVRQLQAMLTDQ